MTRTVQICPVGFEFDRIIEGVRIHSCNVIYLLKSVKKIEKESHPNKRLIEISNMFVSKLKNHFKSTKICTPIVREANVVTLEKTIEELCSIVKEEVEQYNTKEIWINISPSTKLFVSAAMYVGAFYPKMIHLFYIDARHYTINLLLEDIPQDSIKAKYENIKYKYENLGISYKKDEESYKNIDVPSYTMEILKDYKKNILVMLKQMIDSTREELVSFKNLLSELGEDKYNKKTKVRYGHHITYLKKRNWVYERKDYPDKREKKYGLTPEGRILAIIHTHLKEEGEIM